MNDAQISKVRKEIHDAEAARIAALLAGDYEEFGQWLDERVVYTHSTGHRDSKGTLLQSLRDGAFSYHEMETSFPTAVVLGEVAVLSGEMRAVIQIGEQVAERRSAATAVWVHDGGWRLLAFHVTSLAT